MNSNATFNRFRGLVWLVLMAVVWLSAGTRGRAATADVSARFNDWKDVGCRNRYGGMTDMSFNATGGNRAGCPPCGGMPRWWVSEPYMNLWVADEPLSYRTSSGQEMIVRWTYHQRYQLPDAESYYKYGTGLHTTGPLYVGRDSPFYKDMRTLGMSHAAWSMNWLSDLLFWDLSSETNGSTPFAQGYEVFYFVPDGGVEYLAAPSRMKTSGGATLSPVSALGRPAMGLPTPDGQGVYWCGGSTNGFKLEYQDGSVDLYQLCFPLTQNLNSTARAMLTARIDPQGRKTVLGYENASGNDGTKWFVLRPRLIVDPDGRTNRINYLQDHRWRIKSVTDPYGRTCEIGYNYYTKFPDSIVDAVTNVSTFSYMTNGWLARQTTPYGTTRFAYHELRELNSSTNEFISRGVHVVDPEGAPQLFYYLHRGNSGVTSNPAVPIVATHTFDAGVAGTSQFELEYRNSFHWDTRNYANLSSGVTNWLGSSPFGWFNLSTAVTWLTTQDFRKAHLKHWLLGRGDHFSISEQLSSEREPSPDPGGAGEAARTWFDYEGKTSPEVEGTTDKPGCVAWRLPDGTTHYVEQDYNLWGYPTEVRQSHTKGVSLGVRTNYFDYTAGLDLASISNSTGQRVTIHYNTFHQPTNIVDALGQVTDLHWDPQNHNFGGARGPGGWSVLLGLDAEGFPSTINWQPQGLGISIPEYMAGLPRLVHQSGTGLGDLWSTNTWDGLNRLTQTDFPDGTSRKNSYNRLDLVEQKDRMGHRTWFEYDALQHLKTVTDQRSNVTQMVWCGCGALESIRDALTNYTSFTYNNQGLLTGTRFPDNSSISREYDSAGRLVKMADGANRSLVFGYNNQGLVTVVSNAFGRLQGIEFDEMDRPGVVADAAGVVFTNRFDLVNRLTARTWRDNFSEQQGWSTNGLVAHTNRDGKVTRYGRDGAGRLLSETNANLEASLFGYNALGSLMDLWDGRSNHTAWTFDEYGRVRSKIDGMGHEILRLTYNPNGDITNRWTPQFGDTVYRYDEAGNLTNFVAFAPQLSSLGYAYDALNRLKGMSDPVGGTVFTYSPVGKLATEDGPWDTDTVTYSYSQGLRSTLSLNTPTTTLNQSYGYDNAWRLTSLASQAGTFGYEHSGATPLVSRIALPNFSSIVNHYDSLSRLDYTALTNRWGQVLDASGYIHNPVGLRTNIVRNLGSTVSTVTVDYDNIGQITGWTAKEPDQSIRFNEKFGWTYDASGNLRTRANNALVQTFTNDAANQLTGIARTGTLTVSGVTPAPALGVTVNGQAAKRYEDFTFASTNQTLTGNDTFTIVATNAYGAKVTNILSTTLPASLSLKYDLNGNLTNDGTRIFVYDAQNQLVTNSVALAWKSEHVYDGLGRRRITLEYGWQAGAWAKTNETRFIYDGRLVVQERTSTNGVQVTYARGIDLGGGLQTAGGIGGLLVRTDVNGSAFYHADGAGNITMLSDGMESIAARYLYSPFGRLTAKWGPLADANRYQSSSKETDRLSGLSYYGFRFYDPGLQRWLTRDPLGARFDANPYRFNYNGSLSYVDPDGMAPQLVGLSLDLNGGSASPQYSDQKFGRGYGIGAHGPEPSPAAGMMAASMMPGVGEMMDADVLTDPDSALWEKGLAAGSLGLNVLTEGFLPNAGGLLKALKKCPKEKLDKLYPRVKPNKGMRERVRERSKAADGKVYDPSGVEIKPGEPWELGHKPSDKFSDAQQRALEEGWDADTWRQYQRDPDLYRPEKPRTNAGHEYESDW